MASVPASPSKTNDILYETFYSGAVGGSVLALLFLVSDALHGRPLFTPSLLGQTLLMGATPTAAEPINLEAVAWFSAVHFALFGLLGLIGALLVRILEARESRPVWVALVLFGIMEAGVLLPLRTIAPEVAVTIGATRVHVVNLATAVSMVAFLHYARRAEAAPPDGELLEEADEELRTRDHPSI